MTHDPLTHFHLCVGLYMYIGHYHDLLWDVMYIKYMVNY